MKTISGHSELNEEPMGLKNDDYYLLVNCCGHDKQFTSDVTSIRDYGRNDYYLLYVTNGQLKYKLDDTFKTADTGSLFILEPSTSHTFQYEISLSPETYWIHFTGYGVDTILNDLGLKNNSIMDLGLDTDYFVLFDTIINELQIKSHSYLTICQGLLLQLLTLMSRKHQQLNKSINNNNDIQKIITTLHDTYNEKHDVSSLAKLCNLTNFRFIHKFKDITGLSPIQYLTDIRINKAKNLLLKSNLSISEISYIVGYINPLYFSRIFKKYTGHSPSIFRSQNNNKY